MSTKKTILNMLFSIILSLCLLSTSIPIQVQAATTLTINSSTTVEMRSLQNTNYSGDCTYVNVKKGNTTINIVIDAGTNTTKEPAISKLASTNAYSKNTKTYTIDHFIITHSHTDHITGLNYLSDKMAVNNTKVIIKNMYVNLVYFSVNNFQNILYKLLDNNNITIKNIYYFGVLNSSISDSSSDPLEAAYFPATSNYYKRTTFHYVNQIKTVNLVGGCSFSILPALKRFNNFTTESGYDYIDYNNSSMSVVLYDNEAYGIALEFKAIFPGDMQAKGLEAVYNNSTYRQYYSRAPHSKSKYELVYYKASHHGKRTEEFYKGSTTGTNNFFNAEYKLMSQCTKPDYIIGTSWSSKDAAIDKLYKNYSSLLNKLNYDCKLKTKGKLVF